MRIGYSRQYSVDFVLKNVILYDSAQNVSGFAEFKIRSDRTNVKVRHNLNAVKGEMLLSIVAEGTKSYVFPLTGVQTLAEVKNRINPNREIFVCLFNHIKDSTAASGWQTQTLASGIINQMDQSLRSRTDVQSEVNNDISENISERIKDDNIEYATNFPSGLTDEQSFELNIIEPVVTAKNKPAAATAKPAAIKEIDEVLRKVCTIDADGKGQCETCPYRDHFFNFGVVTAEAKPAAGAEAAEHKILVE